MVRAACLAACILLATGCQRETFFCDTAEDCTSAGGGGSCESTGYCSFPDPKCDTGRRYGELAPSGLAGTCVPQMSDTEGPIGTDSTSGSSTSASDPTLVDPTSSTSTSTTSNVTSGASSESSTSEGPGESSSTGGPQVCCDASCSTCGEACRSEYLDTAPSGEALGVAVVGTTVVWTTGNGRQAYRFDLTTGESTLLVTSDHQLSNITADDEYLYYLSAPNGFVGRINLTTGAQAMVTDTSEFGELEAGYGQIVLDDTELFFALANPLGGAEGGAFRAPNVPSPQPPEQIGTLERPVGIGFDEDSIYISDQGGAEGTLLRFDKAAPDPDGTMMLSLALPGHIYVNDTDVYATGDGQLTRVPKDGSAATLLLDGGGDIGGITGDDANVYVTNLQMNTVTRVSLFDMEPPLQIAVSPAAWGIATDCSHVYWCEAGTLSVLRQPK